MNTNKNQNNLNDRSKDRDVIADQVKAFLDSGGEIKVIKSSYELYKDPKCRFGEETGFFK